MSRFGQTVCRCLSILLWFGWTDAAFAQVESAIRPDEGQSLKTVFRRPSSAAILSDGQLLVVANRRSGSVTILDATSGAIRSETRIGVELSDVSALPHSTEIVLTDFAAHKLILALVQDSSIRIVRRIPVARYPVAVAVSPDGEKFAVASLWSRRLSVGRFASEETNSDEVIATSKHDASLIAAKTIDLPFAPHCVKFTSDGSLVICEAFGGRIGFLGTGESELRIHEFPVHNIRELAVRGDRVWFSHQLLRETARTEAEHIHWGVLLENFVSSLTVDSLRQMPNVTKEPLQLEQTRIGDAGNGAGDPSGVAVLADRLAVTLAGTQQLALIDRVGVRETRLATGARPVRVVCDEKRQRAFVVNSHGDSITFVDLKKTEVVRTVSLGPSPPAGPVERGESAFFDARLSLENWMSCHSCHTDGHTNNRLADTPGDGSYGNAKRIPTLLGTAGTAPWGWTGSQMTLVSQVKNSLATTMHTSSVRKEVADDLAVYLKSLSPAPSAASARLAPGEELPRAGAVVFRKAGCAGCHSGDRFTAAAVFDVELEDQVGQRRFNPPSLPGVSQRDRLLHDGRSRSLDELLDVHPPEIALSAEDRRRLIEYLNGL